MNYVMQQHNTNLPKLACLRVLHQHLLPQRWLSKMVGYLMRCQQPWVSRPLIAWFIRRYQVDLSQAQITQPQRYASFNAFFTRHLRADARPISASAQGIVSPADGTISEIGPITDGQLLQAKGHYYHVVDLLGGDSSLATAFQNGSFTTLYLSPKDYHRVHIPVNGTLQTMTYIPGKLFSVSPLTTRCVPGLFARNERVVMTFTTDHHRVIIVMIGAMLVASIATEWAGVINPTHSKRSQTWTYREKPLVFQQGQSIGHFQLGSTVIVLTEHAIQWRMHANQTVQMGARLGRYQG